MTDVIDKTGTLVVIPNPATGEAIELSAPTDILAAHVDAINELQSQLREVKGAISQEVISRMDRERKWTLSAGPYKASAPSDAPVVEYDPERLAHVLTGLVEAGEITPDAMDEAIEQVLTWKVKKRGIEALRKSPKFREQIDACGEERPPEGRRLKVTRA